MSKVDFKLALEKLQRDVDQALQDAYVEGFNAGSAVDKPTQAEFDKAHQEPLGYGEDGEIYVMAGNLSENQALYRLKKLFDKEMYNYEGAEDLMNHMQLTKIAYVPEDISSEPDMSDSVSPYIDIIEVGTSPTGKTKIWHVVNKRDPANDVPGVIKWNGGWRKYVYYSGEAYYDWQCLRQIADFIEDQTTIHKEGKK